MTRGSTSQASQRPQVQVKIEPPRSDEQWQKLTSDVDSHSAYLRKLQHEMDQMREATRGPRALYVPNRDNGGQRPFHCYMCQSTEHGVRDCPIQNEFIEKKILIKNKDNKFTLKDGSPVPYEDSNESRQTKIERIIREKGWDKKTPSTMMFATDWENEQAYFVDESRNSTVSISNMVTVDANRWTSMMNKLDAIDNRVVTIEKDRRLYDHEESEN